MRKSWEFWVSNIYCNCDSGFNNVDRGNWRALQFECTMHLLYNFGITS